jgi:uncharacterized membrane protein
VKESAENYIPVELVDRFHSQAIKVWVITGLVVLTWLLLIVVSPVLAANGQSGISSPIYSFFSYICHQMPERSFFLEGHSFAVCSRCFGVYFGLLAGILAYPFWRGIDAIEPLPRKWLLLSIVPMGIDWSLTVFGIWENTHATRLITGTILGVACATYILPALVEIARNFSGPRRSSV